MTENDIGTNMEELVTQQIAIQHQYSNLSFFWRAKCVFTNAVHVCACIQSVLYIMLQDSRESATIYDHFVWTEGQILVD